VAKPAASNESQVASNSSRPVMRLRQCAPDEPCLFGDQVGVLGHAIADHEGSRHVSPAGALLVTRPDVDLDRKAGGECSGPRLVPIALPDGRDDHVGRTRSPMLGAHGAKRRADVFGEERLPVQLQAAVR
jgi:hypothetical protein